MGYIVEVDNVGRSGHEVTQVGRQLPNPDAQERSARLERRGVTTINLAVLPVPHAVDGVGKLLGDTSGAPGAVKVTAGQGVGVALACREVVVVVIEGGVKVGVVGTDLRDAIEGAEQGGGCLEMVLPQRVARRLDGVEPIARGAAAVLRLQTVDALGLASCEEAVCRSPRRPNVPAR